MTKKMKKHIAFADVGSNGGIFIFGIGSIANNYPTLMQIYQKPLCNGLVPVKILPLTEKEYAAYKKSKGL